MLYSDVTLLIQPSKQTDRQTDRQTDTHTDTQTDTQTDRQTDRQTVTCDTMTSSSNLSYLQFGIQSRL